MNKEILKLTGVEFEEEEILATYAGVGINEGTSIVLHPSFGVTLNEIRSRIKGKIKFDMELIEIFRKESDP